MARLASLAKGILSPFFFHSPTYAVSIDGVPAPCGALCPCCSPEHERQQLWGHARRLQSPRQRCQELRLLASVRLNWPGLGQLSPGGTHPCMQGLHRKTACGFQLSQPSVRRQRCRGCRNEPQCAECRRCDPPPSFAGAAGSGDDLTQHPLQLLAGLLLLQRLQLQTLHFWDTQAGRVLDATWDLIQHSFKTLICNRVTKEERTHI